MTKEEYVAKFKSEHPQIFIQVNDDRIELTGQDYEDRINEWAEWSVEDDKRKAIAAAEAAAKESARQSALAKLAALGLTPEEVAAL
jgi:hypothetical protein